MRIAGLTLSKYELSFYFTLRRVPFLQQPKNGTQKAAGYQYAYLQ
jgi:hypothetical protein